jgi:hypothetical protein
VERFGFRLGSFTLPAGTRLLSSDMDMTGCLNITVLSGGPESYELSYHLNGKKTTGTHALTGSTGWSIV